jgi:hypothetical protein
MAITFEYLLHLLIRKILPKNCNTKKCETGQKLSETPISASKLGVYTCNPSYKGSCRWEDHGPRAALGKKLETLPEK